MNQWYLQKKGNIKYTNEINCHICEKLLNDDKVRDHDHITGKYIGASHNECNVNRNCKNFKIPVFIHNNKGYDAHFIIKEISNFDNINRIKNIPKTDIKISIISIQKLKKWLIVFLLCVLMKV